MNIIVQYSFKERDNNVKVYSDVSFRSKRVTVTSHYHWRFVLLTAPVHAYTTRPSKSLVASAGSVPSDSLFHEHPTHMMLHYCFDEVIIAFGVQ